MKHFKFAEKYEFVTPQSNRDAVTGIGTRITIFALHIYIYTIGDKRLSELLLDSSLSPSQSFPPFPLSLYPRSAKANKNWLTDVFVHNFVVHFGIRCCFICVDCKCFVYFLIRWKLSHTIWLGLEDEAHHWNQCSKRFKQWKQKPDGFWISNANIINIAFICDQMAKESSWQPWKLIMKLARWFTHTHALSSFPELTITNALVINTKRSFFLSFVCCCSVFVSL